MSGVTIKDLTKRYGDVAAVERLSLQVKPGELVALLGPSSPSSSERPTWWTASPSAVT